MRMLTVSDDKPAVLNFCPHLLAERVITQALMTVGCDAVPGSDRSRLTSQLVYQAEAVFLTAR